MVCGIACDEGHTYDVRCLKSPPPGFRRGGPVQGATPRTRVTTYRPGKCANMTCSNRVGEGEFGIITIEDVPGGHKPVMLMLCFPCIEAMLVACRG